MAFCPIEQDRKKNLEVAKNHLQASQEYLKSCKEDSSMVIESVNQLCTCEQAANDAVEFESYVVAQAQFLQLWEKRYQMQ